jgi:hypothetical protein
MIKTHAIDPTHLIFLRAVTLSSYCPRQKAARDHNRLRGHGRDVRYATRCLARMWASWQPHRRLYAMELVPIARLAPTLQEVQG